MRNFLAAVLSVIAVGVMLVSSLLIYRYLKQLGRDQVRAMQQSGRFSIAALLARLSGRMRGPSEPPPQ